MVDFESAFGVALPDVFWENITVKRCYFHLGQSLWSNIQNETLVDLYIKNKGLQLKMKMLEKQSSRGVP